MNKDIVFSDYLFKKIVDYFYKETGISIKDYKKYLVENRLSKFVGTDAIFKDFKELYESLVNDKTGEVINLLTEALTTNWTFFFREEVHFNFLKEYLKENVFKEKYIRLWSAGCSTGEEAYSMAISCFETIPNLQKIDLKILATDISLKVLQFAINGVYHFSKIKGKVADYVLKKYFIFDNEKKNFTVKEDIKKIVYFRYLNLMNNYPFEKEFDVVFLRNVLIYFDNKEKEYILDKIFDVIKKEGYLILGLSESLVGIRHNFKLIKNSIYKKV